MIKGHKIKKEISIIDFLEIIKHLDEENINTTRHTFFRLNEKQRKVFKEKLIKDLILEGIPIFVGTQFNGCYAVFYSFDKEIIRITLDIQLNRINIVTFYIIDKNQMPKI